MTPLEIVLGIASGLAAGILSGLFGVGGGVVATPAISTFLGAEPIVAVASPLPVIFPTALVGAYTYWRAGHLDVRAAGWISVTGALASAGGAAAAEALDGQILLVATGALLIWQAIGVARGRSISAAEERRIPVWTYAAIGVAAGFTSGLLGIGGGIIMVPLLAGLLGMPLKTTLGTSLAAIIVLVIPGTIVHVLLDNIDWAIVGVLAVGSIAGARIGATIALGTKERTLRLVVAAFLGIVGLAYAITEGVTLLGATTIGVRG
ncbi:MAG: sulfite exporter TauE/SafE family protein [Actinomycetota bacterium]